MGDRRKGDRRAPEEGVIRIQKKNVWVYGIVIAFLIFAIILNIISWSAYINSKNQYNTLIDHYYNGESDNSNNTETTTNNTEINNNYTCDISINGNKTSIKPGDSVEYEIRVSNINAGDGIKAIETYIDYDSSIFDCKVESNDENGWLKTGFLEGYLTMYKSDLNASKDEQVIAKIVLTAKADVSAGNYNVTLNNIKFTSGDDQIFKVADNNINIKVD